MAEYVDPLEALERLTMLVGCDSMRRTPGAIVRACRPEVRAALSRLTSDDVAKMRVPEYVCRSGGRRGRAR
jgi:hypothetical protein